MIFSNIKKLIAFSLFCVCASCASAESFRVRKLNLVQVTDGAKDVTVKSGINDACAFILPEDRFFYDGLEIRMSIPESIASWPDTVACSIYNSISPLPSATQIDYSGQRIFVTTLPGRLSWTLLIPFESKTVLKGGKYSTTADSVPSLLDNVLFMRFQPVMKGISEESANANIEMSVRPVLKDIGQLILNLNYPEEDEQKKDVTAYIDDILINLEKPILLPPGIHNLSLVSENYRNEIRTVRIAQAKRTEVTVELRGVDPSILITAPEGTLVFLDENEIFETGKEIKVDMGEHTVKFVIGNYEVTRVIQVNKGKTYKAAFSVDLEISEEE